MANFFLWKNFFSFLMNSIRNVAAELPTSVKDVLVEIAHVRRKLWYAQNTVYVKLCVGIAHLNKL